MATSLSEGHRARLDGLVAQMQANGETDSYIQGVVNDYKTKYAGSMAPPRAPAQAQEQLDPFKTFNLPIGSPFSIRADRAIDAFPSMGGIVGGIAGGIPGAAVYGGAMETLRRSLRGLPLDPKAAAMEGVKQGAFQGIGAGLGAGAALASKALPAAARGVTAALGSPLLKGMAKMGRMGLPIGGAMSHGIPGLAAGMALPMAGKAALKVALSPRTEALLGSMAFRSLARHSPQVAAQIYKQLFLQDQADAQAQ